MLQAFRFSCVQGLPSLVLTFLPKSGAALKRKAGAVALVDARASFTLIVC